MTSTIKVNTIQDSCGSALVSKCSSTITLGASGKTVALATGASQTGFGRTGTVDWCTTAKTSPLTVVSGKGYFINTTSGGITVTLPSSPSAGDIVAFKDYANTWDTNNVTIGRGGSKINGQCEDATLNTESQSVTLIYVDGTKGWQDIHDSTSNVTGSAFVTACGGNATVTCGNFKTHIFTSDGTFTVSGISGCSALNAVDYLIVAGGGSGGTGRGGGGGAGGFRLFSSAPGSNSPLSAPAGSTVSVASFPIVVGGGGAAVTYAGTACAGNDGSASSFNSISSAGGGGGGSGPGRPLSRDGGSGGGGNFNQPGDYGAGNVPPVSPPQGNDGGLGSAAPASPPGRHGGGGGGAGAAGSDETGGAGSYIANPFVGPTAPSYGTTGPVTPTRYFAGGGGAGFEASGGGSGGAGGGATGTNTSSGNAGTTNTGGGGGAIGENPPTTSGAGGSGIVMIRYRYQ